LAVEAVGHEAAAQLTAIWGEPTHSIAGETLWQWRQQAIHQAIAVGVEPTEVDWILLLLTEIDRLTLQLATYRQQTVAARVTFAKLQTLWQQRIQQRIPLQQLVGVAPWRHFWLRVSPAVLIPRPETEDLIELAIQAVGDKGLEVETHWADLGTGSGAIALGLATVLPTATIHAVDYSAAALTIAKVNAIAYKRMGQIKFYQGAWFEPLAHLRGQLKGMVSNPPYIPSQLVSQLQPEVAQHEPHLALDGGIDGLESVRHLIKTAPEYLQSGGIWLVELMAGQSTTVVTLLEVNNSYCQIATHRDLAGVERFVLARRK
jgi:release factor glutamine methyltransferase